MERLSVNEVFSLSDVKLLTKDVKGLLDDWGLDRLSIKFVHFFKIMWSFTSFFVPKTALLI